jgi:excisionase family DNA binding protein
MTNELNKIVTAQEAAEMLGCSRDHIGHLCRNGTLDARASERVWLITRKSVERYADRRTGPGRPPGK